MLTPGTPMYHIGCGRRLYDYEPGQVMALACDCGANSPITGSDLNDSQGSCIGLPASLARILAEDAPAYDKEKARPHIEVYLGFSTFTSPAKDAWETALRQLGCTPTAECTERCCQEYASRIQARVHGESL